MNDYTFVYIYTLTQRKRCTCFEEFNTICYCYKGRDDNDMNLQTPAFRWVRQDKDALLHFELIWLGRRLSGKCLERLTIFAYGRHADNLIASVTKMVWLGRRLKDNRYTTRSLIVVCEGTLSTLLHWMYFVSLCNILKILLLLFRKFE